MEQTNFGYSMKNINIPGTKEYLLNLTHSANRFIHNLRWRVHFHLNPTDKPQTKQTYGFKSLKTAPPVKGLEEFEDGLVDLIKSIKTKQVTTDFQDKLKTDTSKIKKETKVIIQADKTTNFYKMTSDDYKELLDRNIRDKYKKSDNETESRITEEAKTIAKKLELDDRIFKTTKKQASITLKDHKDNFLNNPKCRLINPTKSELGRISKQKVESIVREVKAKTSLTQWKNTASVVTWFQNIQNKPRTKFINFDIVDYYPSVTVDLLNKALDFASLHTTVTQEDREVVHHARRSLLYDKDTPWVKKESEFDVAMGSFDGAEVTDLVGLFLLSQLQHLKGINLGLYRDDGLGTSTLTERQTDILKKQIKKVFESNGLKITIDVNLVVVNFLDVTLDLRAGTFRPFMKPGNTPLYIHKDSNHPPTIIKQIPLAVGKRLSSISSSEAQFNLAAPPYQEALAKSGYDLQLTYEAPEQGGGGRRRRRAGRRVTWFNPPYSLHISTNVGKKFLHLVDTCFPPGHLLHGLLNRNTVKVSYRTMASMGQVLQQHNNKVLKPQVVEEEVEEGCNCRAGPGECPLQGRCLTTKLVYGAAVTRRDTRRTRTYTGLTAATFKKRWDGHTNSFRNRTYQHSSTLSKHIWDLKDQAIPFTITWGVLARANDYNTTTEMCRLCLTEMYFIMFHPKTATLNSRREIFSRCRHRAKRMLSK